jgi:transposase
MIHEFVRMCESVGMAQTVCVLPAAEDRERLLAIVADRNRPLKHVQRAHILLCSADRLPVQEVARRASVSRPAVWRWQARYAEQGVEGLLRDRTRKPGRAPLSAKVVAKVMDLTCSEPPGHATHWTGRAMAKAVGVSLRAVQRLWQAHRLQPHRIRTFKRSNDPEFAEKVEDIVGLYMDPPKHTVVVSIDEKSQIQALDRTQPGLPLKPGKCGTMTHDYKRNGTTTLFAALNILDGTVIGRCMRRHRHQEFIRFLNAVERAVPAGKVVHAIVDNYAAHKQPNVLKWLADHPRWTFHFTPTSASWLNAVEGFFSAITRRQIRRGAFHSIDDLQNAITRYINAHNSDCRPFTWTTSAKAIFEKLAPIPVSSV